MPSDLARMEVRLPTQSREVHDLEQLAEKVRNNATRRGEAATYIIQMWSRVLHGEISPATFWDLFGIQMPLLSPMTMSLSPSGISAASMALAPAPDGMLPGASNIPTDDPESAKQKQKREKAKRNREAASWEP